MKKKYLAFLLSFIAGVLGKTFFDAAKNASSETHQSAEETIVFQKAETANDQMDSLQNRKEESPAVPTGEAGTIADIFSMFGNRPFSDLMDRLRLLKNDGYRNSLEKILLNEWAHSDVFGALEYAKKHPSVNQWESREKLTTVLKHFGASQLQIAEDWLNRNIKDYRDRDYLRMQVYKGIASGNPQSAMKLAENLPAGSFREVARRAVVEEWAAADPSAALSWIKIQPADISLNNLYAVAMREYVKQNPIRAADVVREMGPSDLKIELAGQLAGIIAEQNVKQAIQWIASLGDENARSRGLFHALDKWAAEDADAALSFALKLDTKRFGLPQREDEHAELVYLQQVTDQCAMSDPKSLAARLNDFPEYFRPAAGGYIARSWFLKDPEAAWAWINKLPVDSPVWAIAVRTGVESYLPNDPAMTFSLSSVFEDKPTRFYYMQQSVRRWAKFDPDTARTTIQKDTVLDPHEKELLLNTVNEAGTTDMTIPRPGK